MTATVFMTIFGRCTDHDPPHKRRWTATYLCDVNGSPYEARLPTGNRNERLNMLRGAAPIGGTERSGRNLVEALLLSVALKRDVRRWGTNGAQDMKAVHSNRITQPFSTHVAKKKYARERADLD